jgi:hypothetical protein
MEGARMKVLKKLPRLLLRRTSLFVEFAIAG